MLRRAFRGRDAIAVDLVGVAGILAFFLGLTWLQASEQLAFDPGAALDGVLSQLAVTLPAAILILGATALELAAGLVLARQVRRRPFDSSAEALLAAMVAAVIKDTFLLGTLAAAGLFLQPVLVAVDVVIIGAGIWQARTQGRALLETRGWRESAVGFGSITLAALVAIVWIGPVVLQLASPVVPFIDVLPNYVGPVEHLRTFGWFSPLDATQSPIIGPSRTVLGYDGLLGALATMTNLPGGLAIAGFILPQTILVAAGVHRLASGLPTGRTSIGSWALLAFALSQPFARLADARGTVVVVPLVLVGLALAAELLRERAGEADDPWRIGRGAVIGLALGSATLVHPVIGFFAIATVAIAALVRPNELAAAAFVATLTAGLIAIPQAATMAGFSVMTILLGAWLPIALLAGATVGVAIGRRAGLAWGLVRLAKVVRWIAIALVLGGIGAAFAAGAFETKRLSAAWEQGWKLILESSGLLLVVTAAGIALGSRGARSPLIVSGLGVGIGAVILVSVLPADLGFLGDALRFEVPKTVHYWLSMVAAAGAAAALAHVSATGRIPLVARAAALAGFVIVAALPLRPKAIDAYHLGEHRWSETFAIDLRFAATGFWVGFPDSRTVVDAPRQELLDVLRTEIAIGRLRHDTEVLHVARTFQQWESTPLGVFDGVYETSLSLEPEVTHQTVAGRLFGSKDPVELLAQLQGRLFDRPPAYIVLEPGGMPEGVPEAVRAAIVAAGFHAIFVSEQGEVFRPDG